MFEHIEAIQLDLAGRRVRGRARIAADLPALADHFPGAPVLPGSWQIELAAQIAGPLVEALADDRRWALLAMVRSARFLAPVPLPAALVLEARARRIEGGFATAVATIRRDTQPTLRAELVLALRPAEPGWARAIADREARLARWQKAWACTT